MGVVRILMLGVAIAGQAAPQPPDTEVFLASLSVHDGTVAIGKPINISNHPGYDNQPSFTPDGQPELVLRDVKPVGYHAWADASLLALFVLGQQGQPATLQVADLRTGRAQVAATGIGRSIQRMPGGNISYVACEAAAEGQAAVLTITELDPATRQTRALVRAPAGATEAETAWTPDGLLLVTVRGQLLGWRRGAAEMTPVADFERLGLRSVTRLAISPKGDWIALVAPRP